MREDSFLPTSLWREDRLAMDLPFLPDEGIATPALRAFDKPIAIACFVDRAPCTPWRICAISARTNSPACVVGDLPSLLSRRALFRVRFSGILESPFTSEMISRALRGRDGSSATTVDLTDGADFVHDLRHNDLVDFGANVRAIPDHDTQRLHQFFLRVRLQEVPIRTRKKPVP